MPEVQSQPRPDPVRGAQIGPYEVLSRLALGGMAELLLARRVGIEGFQKLVVLKRILPQYASNPDFVEMFLHEARLAAALEHPNIVQVFDIGKSGDDYYFAMAYLHGKDALTILRELGRTRQQLPVEHAIAIGSGIAAGLHHAHEQIGFDGQPLGIVHRDVSPANAIVTFDGAVKLVDFGIAKAAAQVNHTRAGVRKGKAAYMSPEQCRGDALDRRTDIWSLGVMLYELFTMTRLFRADNDLATMHRIVSMDAPSPRLVRPELAPGLEAIVQRCLQRDREQRYPTAAALQHDLDACAHDLGLRPGAAGLSAFLRGLFGTPPLPWAPAGESRPGEPVTHSVELESGDGSERGHDVDSTRDLGNTPPPALNTEIAASSAGASSSAIASEPPRRGGDLRVAIAIGLAIGLGGAAWLLWPDRDDTAVAEFAAVVPASSAPPAPDLEAWLRIVHRADAGAAPIGERHRLLAELRRTAAASRIDEALQVRLDLAQAADAARPCETFATALERAAQDVSAFADAIASAVPPDPARHPAAGRAPDRPCDDLPARVAALRGEASPASPTPAAPTLEAPTPETKPRPRRRPSTDPAAAPPAAAPPSAAGKLDDELRPFRK